MAPEMVGASESSIRLEGGPVSVDIVVDPRAVASESIQRAGRFWEDAASSTRLYVNIEHIDAEENPGVAYGVYLESPGGAAEKHRYHLGNLALFGIEEIHRTRPEHEGGGAMRLTFDVTDIVRDLQERGLAGEAFRVTFEPLQLEPAEEFAEPAAQLRAPITIGRVSLFVT